MPIVGQVPVPGEFLGPNNSNNITLGPKINCIY